MKRLLIILTVIALVATALGYRIPVTATMGGGLAFDSIRIVVQRQASNSATITNVEDTTINTGGTYLAYSIYVDSLYQHQVAVFYYVGTDTFREVSEQWPVQLAQYLSRGVANSQAMRDSGEYYAQVGASGGGSGCPDSVGNAWTIVTYDSVNNEAVNARVTIKSSLNTSTVLGQATAPFTFTKSSGTFYVIAEANGITFPPRQIAISGARTDTIKGGGVTTVAPSAPDEATVYGTLVGGDGELASSWYVRFTLEDVKANLADTSTGQIIALKVVETSTNGSGYFSVGLLKTENLLYKSGTAYKHPVWRVVASPTDVKSDPRLDFTFSIPADSTTINLGELIKEGAE